MMFAAPPGHFVNVSFNGYTIEESKDCKYDSLTFQDGPFVFSPVLRKLCGNGTASWIASTTRYMRLSFKTDEIIERAGFMMNYSFIPIKRE